jgi:hypothetical protein
MSQSSEILVQRAITETDLAAGLGVARRTLQAVRDVDLIEGVDFMKKGGRVRYTENGVRHVSDALDDAGGAIGRQGVAETLLSAAEGVQVKKSAPAVRVCEVTNSYLRMGWANPRLVSGIVDGTGMRVRVCDAQLFRPGMRIEVRIERPGMAVATRRPRARGVW